jgi:secondary thiamine-phosphate synthase enzyme
MQAHHSVSIATSGPGFSDVTHEAAAWLAAIEAQDGLLTLFVRHTSASLTIQENADPDVLRDLADALDKLAPRHARYRHTIEGADDMPAHIRSMLTSVSLGVPVVRRARGAGHMAGHLSGRAPRPAACARDRPALRGHAASLSRGPSAGRS